jgi:hypothetical protein
MLYDESQCKFGVDHDLSINDPWKWSKTLNRRDSGLFLSDLQFDPEFEVAREEVGLMWRPESIFNEVSLYLLTNSFR